MQNDAVLIHGWDPSRYNSKVQDTSQEGIAWSHRQGLIDELSAQFNVRYYNLPGFAGTPEPDVAKYDVEDFARDFSHWKDENAANPALIIGYSFGGAVALMHKALTNDPTPTVLISPAIFRGESLRSGIGGMAKNIIPEMWENQFRHLYQLLMSKYYREGTPFLRETYNVIVRRDLRYLLSEVDPSGIFLIYGENDEATPYNLVKNDLDKNNLGYHVIAGGEHSIGQTHPKEIIEEINRFLGISTIPQTIR